MEGQIGALFQNGKQVGGVYNWEINLAFDSTIKDGWEKIKVVKHVKAQGYWLVELPIDNLYDVELYEEIDNQLVLMDTGKAVIDLPDIVTLDRRLDAPLRIGWIPIEYGINCLPDEKDQPHSF